MLSYLLTIDFMYLAIKGQGAWVRNTNCRMSTIFGPFGGYLHISDDDISDLHGLEKTVNIYVIPDLRFVRRH